MPLYQNSSVTSAKLVIGNYKIETAATIGGTMVNLGAGMVSSINHNIEKYDVQAGNAPDPLEGVSDETITVDMELIEYDASVLNAVFCGLIAASTSSSVQTIHAGGNATLTERAFKLTNTRYVSGATVQTIIGIYHATIDNGLQFTVKSDNDADPIQVMPISITGKILSTRTTGQQLFYATRDVAF